MSSGTYLNELEAEPDRGDPEHYAAAGIPSSRPQIASADKLYSIHAERRVGGEATQQTTEEEQPRIRPDYIIALRNTRQNHGGEAA